MASNAAKVRRRAEALNRLNELSVLLSENLKIEVPDVRITHRDPELAEIQRIESINNLLEQVLKASDVEVPEPQVSEPAAEAPEESGEPEDLEGLKKAELLELAEERGVEVSKSAKKADIIEAIEGA